LFKNDLANLAIEFPDLFVERRHHLLVQIEYLICNLQKFIFEFGALQRIEALAAILFKEAPQNVMQKFAGVQGLQIERRLPARFELQYSLGKKAISALAKGSQRAGAMDGFRT